MTQMYETTRAKPDVGSGAWAGWVTFAAIMLAISGAINLVQGFVALFRDGYFLVQAGNKLLVTDYTAWGIIMLAWGALLIGAGFALGSGRAWGRWAAIIIASVSIIVQIGFLSAYPIWSTIIIAFDVIILYALTARWSEARARM